VPGHTRDQGCLQADSDAHGSVISSPMAEIWNKNNWLPSLDTFRTAARWPVRLVEDGLETMVQYGAETRVSVTEAKGELTELVRRAEAGDEVILTRHGQPAVRLVTIKTVPDAKTRRALMEAARTSGVLPANPGPSAARSQDFLYG